MILFLINGLFNISLFTYFFFCHWKHMFFVLHTVQLFLSALPALTLTSPLLPALGENRNNTRNDDITWFIKSSPQYPNPPMILRWMLYKSTAKELKEKKCNRAALTQITHFKLRPEVSKPPNYPKSLCLKPRGYMFMHCRIRPPLYLTLWVMLSKKVGLFNEE